MKKLLLTLSLAALCAAFSPLQAQRYLSEVFAGVTVTSNVMYAQNITVITGSPALDSLYMDIYEPTGDVQATRPVIIMSHTGSFLPNPLNGATTGSKLDTAMVHICKKLAKRGFVVASISYRLGWNPQGAQEVRTGTLINAAYRGVQDARTAVRFLRADYAGANNYGIDTSRIIMGGMGSGGYLALAAGYLNSYDGINLPKFLDPISFLSYVDTSLSGDLEGKNNRPLNMSNHAGFSSDVDFVFNMGGAIGDSTWMSVGDVPVVSFHVPSDPFAPYMYGAVIVPVTGDFVVDVSGSHDIVRISNYMGNNDPFNAVGNYNDAYSTRANQVNDGHRGLFPFLRPSPESAPWEYWDATYWNAIPHPAGGTFHTVALQTNPDMSMAKSNAYIDSVLSYVAPRIVCGLNLGGCTAVAIDAELDKGAVSVYPNPSSDKLNITLTGNTNLIEAVSVIDVQGRLVKRFNNVNAQEFSFDHTGTTPGMYFLNVITREGITTQKVIFD